MKCSAELELGAEFRSCALAQGTAAQANDPSAVVSRLSMPRVTTSMLRK